MAFWARGAVGREREREREKTLSKERGGEE